MERPNMTSGNINAKQYNHGVALLIIDGIESNVSNGSNSGYETILFIYVDIPLIASAGRIPHQAKLHPSSSGVYN